MDIVVAIEIFYTVLESMVKIWILNRVSIYIGFIMYCLYLVALCDVMYGDILVTTLFIARFVAFVFGTILDFCIDLELHRDLQEKAINKLEIPMCLKTKEEHKSKRKKENSFLFFFTEYDERISSQKAPRNPVLLHYLHQAL